VSRVQLALNVPDIDEAVAFYSKLFAAEPNKRKPGYANFAIADPPLKLVLFEHADAESRLNHLGVEVESSDEVWAHQSRLTEEGVGAVEESGTCCFAKQDKVWVDAPDGAWEIYTVLEDSETFGRSSAKAAGQVDEQGDDALCCASVPEGAARCCG
jgi:catechol 2,3-dioxygenase-like lactoylglutathione lyase family enzyme